MPEKEPFNYQDEPHLDPMNWKDGGKFLWGASYSNKPTFIRTASSSTINDRKAPARAEPGRRRPLGAGKPGRRVRFTGDTDESGSDTQLRQERQLRRGSRKKFFRNDPTSHNPKWNIDPRTTRRAKPNKMALHEPCGDYYGYGVDDEGNTIISDSGVTGPVIFTRVRDRRGVLRYFVRGKQISKRQMRSIRWGIPYTDLIVHKSTGSRTIFVQVNRADYNATERVGYFWWPKPTPMDDNNKSKGEAGALGASAKPQPQQREMRDNNDDSDGDNGLWAISEVKEEQKDSDFEEPDSVA